MLADGVEALGWAMWLTPFGLLAETAPYAGNRPAPLAVLAAAAVGATGLALAAAARRDVGAGLLPAPAERPPRLALLGSVAAFAVRRARAPVAGWAAALGAYFLLVGMLAVSMTDFLAANPTFAEAAAAAGFAELAAVEGYAAALLGLLPVPVGVFPATRLAAAAGDERDGRLTLLLAAPVSRPAGPSRRRR